MGIFKNFLTYNEDESKQVLKLMYHQDGGHGWIEVPKFIATWLELNGKISDYSYEDNESYFLEEDCDAGVLLNSIPDGITLECENIYYDGMCYIRNLPRVHS